MKPEYWQRAKEIIPAARELPADERPAFLDEACDGDEELRHEVESLLASDLESVEFLEQSPIRLLGEENAAIEEGSQVGSYRILKKLGSGGMGVVSLAARIDVEFSPQVAIKVLQPGSQDDDSGRRFRQEIQILANLNHPNIARLFEGGRNEDGRLYYLMEYVEGKPIDVHCREKALPLEERLRLFQKVCAAVQYAHRNLVVHRDLKPSNILVTEEGEPKLLDFGVAKPLEGAGITTAMPTTGIRKFFTPDYASPEQITGNTITTASDIYSLGVLLYELLVGARPYRLKTRNEDEIRRVVCEETPTPPSTVPSHTVASVLPDDPSATDSTTASFRQRLRGDLDTIVLMALRKEPERRYPSVEQFSDDIERHLDGLPVRARPDTWSYRTGKLLRRHWLGIGAVAAFFLLSVGFGVAMAVQQRETARERDLARKERDRAEQVTSFLESIFHGANPYENPGEPPSTSELLERGTERLLNDTDMRADIRGNILYTLATISMRIGEFETGLQQIEAALPRLRQEFGQFSVHHSNALSLKALIHQSQGQYEDAENLFRQALETSPDTPDHRAGRAAIYTNLGRLLISLRKWDEALDVYERSRAIYENEDLPLNEDYTVVLNNLAGAYSLTEDYSKAEILYTEVLRLQREILGKTHPRVAITLNDFGEMYRRLGRFAEAEDIYREAVLIFEHNHGRTFLHVGVVLANLSLAQQGQEEYTKAIESLEQALSIFEKTIGTDHPTYALTLRNKASLLLRDDKVQQAELMARKALTIIDQHYPKGHRAVAHAQYVLGACLVELQQFHEAEKWLLLAFETLNHDTNKPPTKIFEKARESLRELYLAWGKPKEAERYATSSE